MVSSTRVAEPSKDAAREGSGVTVGMSVVVPVAERCVGLVQLYETHAAILRSHGIVFEFIFVIDGGFGEACKVIHPLVARGEPIRLLPLPRRYGEARALAIGCEAAKADLIVTLPSYPQTVPEAILELLKGIELGADLVIACRSPRQDPWINRIQNAAFHWILFRMSGTNFRDLGCGVRAIRKRVVHEIDLYGDMHRFLPILAYRRGFHVSEMPVPQHPQDAQMRLYHPGIYLRRLLDIFTVAFLFKFTKKPLRFFGLIGAGLFGAGLMITGLLVIQRVLGLTALSGRPLLVLGALLMVLGVQTGSIGLLGEMIIFTHARRMKDYTVEKYLR